MKEKLTNNLWLKLLSVGLAFLLWLVVINISNPVVTRTKEVAIEVENESVLAASKQTYEIIGKSTVTISYDVRTLDEHKIRAADFRAYIDLADLYEPTGSVPVEIEILNNRELLAGSPVAVAKPGSVRIKTENIQRKGFDLNINHIGTPEGGYALGETSINTDYVYVRGPESLVGQINSVGIEINIETAKSDLEGTAVPNFYDANGNILSLGDNVTMDVSDVSYTVQILKEKKIPLVFDVGGTVYDGYRFTGIASDLREVDVVGIPSQIEAFNSITIPASVLNIDGATENIRYQIDLKPYLPENVSLSGSQDTVTVELNVVQLSTKTIDFNTANIIKTGESSIYTYDFSITRAEAVIRGMADELADLKVSDLTISVDVSGFEAGTYKAVLNITVDNSFDVVSYSDFDIIVTAKPSTSINPETEAETLQTASDGETSQ